MRLSFHRWAYNLLITGKGPTSVSSGKLYNITMENHHCLKGKSTISMAIFNNYVKLLEGSGGYILSITSINQY
jgi:hypothetical protein